MTDIETHDTEPAPPPPPALELISERLVRIEKSLAHLADAATEMHGELRDIVGMLATHIEQDDDLRARVEVVENFLVIM